VEDNILTQLVREPTGQGTPLDLLFANREGLVGDVMAGDHFGHSNHEVIEFAIFGGGLAELLPEGRLWPVEGPG